VAAGAGVGGGQEDELKVNFFESMKRIIFNVFSCLLSTNVHETYLFESIFPGTDKTGTGPFPV